MILGTLGARLLGNILSSLGVKQSKIPRQGVMRAGEGTIRASECTIRAGEETIRTVHYF